MAPPPNYMGIVFSTQVKQRKSFNSCCVPHCTTNYGDLVSFHYFPKDKQLKKEWKIKCRIVSKSNNLKVCGKHFLEIDFIKGS